MPFRVKLLGCVSFLASPACPIQCRITGEISLAFGHAMEVRMSRRLRSGVPPFTPYKACFIACVVWGIYSITL